MDAVATDQSVVEDRAVKDTEKDGLAVFVIAGGCFASIAVECEFGYAAGFGTASAFCFIIVVLWHVSVR